MTTRADKIADYLDTGLPGGRPMDHDVAEIIRLATPTSYASIKDVADLTGRNKGTLLSWMQRGQHDVPQALGWTSAGMIWDRQDWVDWAYAHQGLVYTGLDEG